MQKLDSYQVEAIEYPLAGGESLCLNFKITGAQSQTTTANTNPNMNINKGQYILFVLDVSGSMSGSPIKTCVDVLKEMFEYLYNDLGNTEFDLITFNNSPKFIELKNMPLETRLTTIKKITASGGTQFIPVFETITNLIKPEKAKSAHSTQTQEQYKKVQDLSIVFLSDGQAENITLLQPHIHNLNEAFKAYTRNCEFHTLGFSRDHDAKLLGELTLAGTSGGSFQYIQESKDIKGAMDALSGIFASSKLSGELHIEGLTPPLKVSFEEGTATEMGSSIWEGMVFLDMPWKMYEEKKETLRILLQKGDTMDVCSVVLKKDPSTDNKEKEIRMSLLAMHEALNKITFRLTKQKVTTEQVEEINGKLNGFKIAVEDLIREIFKLKMSQRDALFEMVEDVKKYLGTFTELIRTNFLTQLNNEQIAKLNSMAYRNVTRKGLLKKLDKRAHKTVPIINEAFEKVKTIAEGIDVNGLSEKHKELIDKIGNCALTCYNFVEALKEEDCLCISFDLERPEIAIADVTRITIKKIYPTIISARSFMDSAKFAINKDSEASGGFGVDKQGSIVKGVGSENITAVLPIYICKEHWDIASLLMKPILGWDITLDPVGYSYFQKKVVPFMLLAHAVKMRTETPESEFNKRVFDLLMETCVQIVKDDMEPEFGGTMKDDVTKIHEEYLRDGSVRTQDSVQSNFVHLSQLYVFVKMGLLKKPSKAELLEMLKYMAEEELRRKQTDWDSSQANKYITELLKVDVPKYLKKLQEQEEEVKKEDKVVQEEKIDVQETQEEKLAKAFLMKVRTMNPGGLTKEEKDLIKNAKEVKEEEKKADEVITKKEVKEKKETTVGEEVLEIPTSEFLKGESLQDFHEAQQKAYEEYEALYKTIYKSLFDWVKYFFPEEEFDVEQFNSLEKLGINSSAKFLSLYMQNKLHAKSADRKYAFTAKKYSDSWSQEEAVDCLQKLYLRIVLAEKLRLDKTKNNTDIVQGSDVWKIFAETDDLNVAGGILMNGVSVGEFQILQDILRSWPDSNQLVLEKLKMIRDKEFRGVAFPVTVVMRKRFLRKLFKTYIYVNKYNEWKELWFK